MPPILQKVDIPTITVIVTLIGILVGWYIYDQNNLREDAREFKKDTEDNLARFKAEQELEHERILQKSFRKTDTERYGMFTEKMFQTNMVIRDQNIADLWKASNDIKEKIASLKSLVDAYTQWTRKLGNKQDTITEDRLPEHDKRIAAMKSIVETRLSEIEDDLEEVAKKQDDVMNNRIPRVMQELLRLKDVSQNPHP